MNEVNNKEFTHLKIHTQYSICEGALRTNDLAKYCKTNKIKAVGLCDTNNLCGALEFSESFAKPQSYLKPAQPPPNTDKRTASCSGFFVSKFDICTFAVSVTLIDILLII